MCPWSLLQGGIESWIQISWARRSALDGYIEPEEESLGEGIEASELSEEEPEVKKP